MFACGGIATTGSSAGGKYTGLYFGHRSVKWVSLVRILHVSMKSSTIDYDEIRRWKNGAGDQQGGGRASWFYVTVCLPQVNRINISPRRACVKLCVLKSLG